MGLPFRATELGCHFGILTIQFTPTPAGPADILPKGSQRKMNMPPTLRHFIDTQDFSRQELLDMIELTLSIKAADRQGCTPPLLKGASLAMIFEEPSTRTRVSFEVAMTELGGHALYLKPGEIHLGVRESMHDTAKVLSRMCDAIFARTLKHDTITELARHAEVPVLNGLSDYNHPTQVVCDVTTMIEHMPAGKKLEDINVTFIGDATNVLSSLMLICTRLGMHFTHAAPSKYQAPAEWLNWAKVNCQESGGTLTVTQSPIEAVREADFIYTDLWWWVGQEDQIPDRRAAFMPDFQVNQALFEKAPSHCKFMHCLPASRGVEVTDWVMDHPRSIIFDQSENRLHTEKSLLVYFIYPRLQQPDAKLQVHLQEQIEGFLKGLK
jgi:putrescine carbamoyltransferase